LGWLNVVQDQLNNLDKLAAFSADIKSAGFRRALRINIQGNLSNGLFILQKTLDEAYRAII